MATRLTYAAPKRCKITCSCTTSREGKRLVKTNHWRDVPWTVEEVMSALSAGAFFVRGRHDFADAEAERAAGLGKASSGLPGSIQRWLKQLAPDQLEMLKAILTKDIQP